MKDTKILVLIIVATLTFTIVPTVNVFAEMIPEKDYTTELLPSGTLGMEWTLPEILSGTTMSFSSFQGKVILLDFFATWCNPCRAFAPELIAVKNHYPASKFVIISIDTDYIEDTVEEIRTFADEEDMDWYIFQDTSALKISSFYQISSIPTFYIFNDEQRITYSQSGAATSTIMINEINKLIPSEQTTASTSSGEPLSGFWAKNWYWFVILAVFLIIGVSIYIQRIRVLNENKRIRKEQLEEKEKRKRKRWR